MHPFLGKKVSHLCISEDTKLKGHRLLRRRGLKMQLPCRMSQLGMWSRMKRCYRLLQGHSCIHVAGLGDPCEYCEEVGTQ